MLKTLVTKSELAVEPPIGCRKSARNEGSARRSSQEKPQLTGIKPPFQPLYEHLQADANKKALPAPRPKSGPTTHYEQPTNLQNSYRPRIDTRNAIQIAPSAPYLIYTKKTPELPEVTYLHRPSHQNELLSYGVVCAPLRLLDLGRSQDGS